MDKRVQWALMVPVALAIGQPGAADVYRCKKDGMLVFTDQPCRQEAQPHALPPAVIIASPGPAELELARQHRERIAREQGARDRADSQWLKDHRTRSDRDERVRKAAMAHKAVQGMTADEVRRAMGEPDRVARSDSHGSPKETWTYTDENGTRTVNFKDGEVSSVSSRGRRKKK